jgi:hypothetical protein
MSASADHMNQVALVSQTKHVTTDQVMIVAAAVQKQVTRDFAPVWGVSATVNAFDKLAHVPLGYWAVVIRDDIKQQGAAGIHLNRKNKQPYALVQYSPDWSLTASHETLEMLADPYGNRVVAGDSVNPKRPGRVNYLVEVCDPSEGGEYGYTVNGVLVSDFYTPSFFDPVAAAGVRYSFTGAITKPRQVLDGGYLSWQDPATTHLWQEFVEGGRPEFVDHGPVPDGFGSLREFSDRAAEKRSRKVLAAGKRPPHPLMTGLLGAAPPAAAATAQPSALIDDALQGNADVLQAEIDTLLKASKK